MPEKHDANKILACLFTHLTNTNRHGTCKLISSLNKNMLLSFISSYVLPPAPKEKENTHKLFVYLFITMCLIWLFILLSRVSVSKQCVLFLRQQISHSSEFQERPATEAGKHDSFIYSSSLNLCTIYSRIMQRDVKISASKRANRHQSISSISCFQLPLLLLLVVVVLLWLASPRVLGQSPSLL